MRRTCMSMLVVLSMISAAVVMAQTATLTLDTSKVINNTGAYYRSITMDWHLPSEETPAWGNASILNANLENPIFITLAKNLAPAILRIGGSEGDMVTYMVGSNPPTCTQFCLNMTRWAQINAFVQATGLHLVFGLNAMFNRANSTSPWDSSNTVAFLQYTAQQGYPIFGFELGNELTTKVDPKVLGADFVTLSKLLATYPCGFDTPKYWPNPETRPRLIGPDLNPNTPWLDPFLSVCGPVLDVITYHLYIGYGLNPGLVEQLQDPSFLDTERSTAIPVSTSLGTFAPQAELWAGETAAAWHSGQAGTTNAFISSLWYVDQLGTLATLNHKGFCRQALVGGYYGLLNWTNLAPSPDYYTALFWNAYMGPQVLSIAGDASVPEVRVYAQCSGGEETTPGSVTLALINLSNSTTYNITLPGLTTTPRKEWHITAPYLLSTQYYVNGQSLAANVDGSIPEWIDVTVTDPSASIYIAPSSIEFVALLNAKVGVCM